MWLSWMALWVQNDFRHRCHHVLNLRASFCKIDHRTFWHYTDVQTVAQHLVMLGWSTLVQSRICSLMDLRITVHSSQRVESFEEKKAAHTSDMVSKEFANLTQGTTGRQTHLMWAPWRPSGESLTRQRNVQRASPQNTGRAETATTVRLENLTLDTLRKLVDSIPHRLENVRKDKGRHSGY